MLCFQHLALLKRYWDLSFGSKQQSPPFVRKSPFWHSAGGFSSDNPAEDLRGMGELGLRCLLFFMENYPGEAAMMKRARGGYPFVKAALAVARALCEIFRLVDEEGESGKFPVTRTLYWQVLESDASFFQLFSLLFLLFDELYCEEVATNWGLQDEIACSTAIVSRLVDAAKLKLLRALVKAPMRVDDLRDLCSNAHHALNKNSDRVRQNNQVASGNSVRTGQPVSLWKQHETQRKTMREASKNWHHDGNLMVGALRSSGRCPKSDEIRSVECLERLQPRQPEISFSPPEALSHELSVIEETISITSDDDEEEEEKDEELHPEAHKYEKNGVKPTSCYLEPEEADEVDIFKGLVFTKAPVVTISTIAGESAGLSQAARVG